MAGCTGRRLRPRRAGAPRERGMSAAAPRGRPRASGRARPPPRRLAAAARCRRLRARRFAAAHWGSWWPTRRPGGSLRRGGRTGRGRRALLSALGARGCRGRPCTLPALGGVVAAGALALVVTGLPARLLRPGSWDELGAELDRGLAGHPHGDLALRRPRGLGPAGDPARRPAAAHGGRRAVVLARPRAAPRRAPRSGLLLRCSCSTASRSPSTTRARRCSAVSCCSCSWRPGCGCRGCAAARRVAAAGRWRSWAWLPCRSPTASTARERWWTTVVEPVRRQGRSASTGTTPTARWTGRARAPRCSTSSRRAPVLEGRDAGHLRRPALGAHQRQRGTEPARRAPGRARPALDRAVPGHGALAAHGLRGGRRHPLPVIGAGEAVSGSADGTLRRLDEPLERGDSYTVRSYAPDPTPSAVRAAAGSTRPSSTIHPLDLPRGARRALRHRPTAPSSLAAARGRACRCADPTRGRPTEADRRCAASPYARTYAPGPAPDRGCAHGLRGRSQRPGALPHGLHLQRAAAHPPLSAGGLPVRGQDRLLPAVLGRDGADAADGGHPGARGAGFSPGSLNRDTGEYRVRDLDAHSWVEVYFHESAGSRSTPRPPRRPGGPAGQGPRAAAPAPRTARATPWATAPARSPTAGATRRGRPRGRRPTSGGGPRPGVLVGSSLAARGRRRRSWWPAAGSRRPGSAEAGLRELERALPRLGWPLPAGTTLLELERRLRRAGGPGVGRLRAAAAGALRPAPRAPPAGAPSGARCGASSRRAAAFARLRGFLALPPRRSRGFAL